MSTNMQKLKDSELEKVIGGKAGQGVDDGAVRIVMAHCPNCCKTGDELTRFEVVGSAPARCIRCNTTTAMCKVEKA